MIEDNLFFKRKASDTYIQNYLCSNPEQEFFLNNTFVIYFYYYKKQSSHYTPLTFG